MYGFEFRKKIYLFICIVPKYYTERQRFTIPEKNTPLVDDTTIGSYNLREGDIILFKDLGMQFYSSSLLKTYIHFLYIQEPKLATEQ